MTGPRRPDAVPPEGSSDRVVETLVRAVVDPEAWREAAEELRSYLEVEAVSIAARRPEGLMGVLGAAGVDQGVALRPLRPLAASQRNRSPLSAFTAARPLAPIGVSRLRHQRAWWVPSCREAGLVWAAVHETPTPRFKEAATRLAELDQMIGPAIDGAVRLRRAEATTEHLQSAIDQIAVGAVVTDENDRVVAINRTAKRALETIEGIAVVHGRLATNSEESTRTLNRVLATCRRSGGTRAVRLENSPVELLVACPEGRPHHTIVLLVPPGADRFLPDEHLRGLYGLTAAEIRLVHRLLEGHSLSSAAEALDISRNTAHSQLTSVFQKTATHRQSDLIALLLRGPAAWHRAPSGSFPKVPS